MTLLPRLEAAAYIRRSPRTLDKLRGAIPYYLQGRNVFFAKEDLDQWLEIRKVGSASPRSGPASASDPPTIFAPAWRLEETG